MRISKRLQALFDLVPVCEYLVDIGTDHGLLMIAAVKNGRCTYAYGLDIVEGPLKQAAANVKKYGLSDEVELVLSDGLKSFKAKGDVFVIAGMGAETILNIVKGYEFNDSQEIIIQSNTKNAWLRQNLSMLGFIIVDETFIIDNSKPVFMMKIKKGIQKLTPQECYFGPILMKQDNLEYNVYLKQHLKKLEVLHKKNEDFTEEYEYLSTYLSKRSD